MQANSLKDLLQSKIDDLEKQVLSRVNSIEEGKPGLRNETEQRGRVESTLTSLHQRITDLEKGARRRRESAERRRVGTRLGEETKKKNTPRAPSLILKAFMASVVPSELKQSASCSNSCRLKDVGPN